MFSPIWEQCTLIEKAHLVQIPPNVHVILMPLSQRENVMGVILRGQKHDHVGHTDRNPPSTQGGSNSSEESQTEPPFSSWLVHPCRHDATFDADR